MINLAKFLLSVIGDLTKPAVLEIYTDGSSKYGWGTWAYVVTKRGQILKEVSGQVHDADSNTMEFQAAIEALSSLPLNTRAVLYSDSRILVDAMSLELYPRTKNLFNMVEKLTRLTNQHKVQWKWVKAHNGSKFNERCDQLCINARLHKNY
ncbi:MAG: RNase H family protein [Bdellovibrionota bacterium]